MSLTMIRLCNINLFYLDETEDAMEPAAQPASVQYQISTPEPEARPNITPSHGGRSPEVSTQNVTSESVGASVCTGHISSLAILTLPNLADQSTTKAAGTGETDRFEDIVMQASNYRGTQIPLVLCSADDRDYFF